MGFRTSIYEEPVCDYVEDHRLLFSPEILGETWRSGVRVSLQGELDLLMLRALWYEESRGGIGDDR